MGSGFSKNIEKFDLFLMDYKMVFQWFLMDYIIVCGKFIANDNSNATN